MAKAPNNVMVIGVGGTGKWILTYLKQSLIHATNHSLANLSPRKSLEVGYDQSIPENIRLLCLDTDKKQVTVDGVSLNYDEVTGNEFICLTSQEIVRFKDDLIAKANREFDDTIADGDFPWFEADDARMLTNLPDLHGAGAQRQFSRLTFLMNELETKAFQNKIKEVIKSFGKEKSYFIIVGSIAGGTGAGAFQDLMMFLRHVTKSASPKPTICSIAVLSNAFRVAIEQQKVDEQLMKSNCIAALREFQRYVVLHGEKYPSNEYPGFKGLTHINDLPCDVMYLMDGTRLKSGTDLTSTPASLSLYPAIADYLQALCCHAVTSFDPTNTKNCMNDTEYNLFSTFGNHTWICPVEDIISTFSIRLSKKYVSFILEAAPPNYRAMDEVNDLLINSEKYYGLNSPRLEFYRGVSASSNDRFSFLNQINTITKEYSQNPTALPMDADYLKASFFNALQFPKRYNASKANKSQDMLAGCDLPDLDTVNTVDLFKSHEKLKSLSEPQQVINKAREIFAENIGDKSDVFDPSDSKNRITYHAILQYYEKLALENFGGLKDLDGNFRPGILENKIFLILNEKVTASKKKLENGDDDNGESGLPRYNVTYRVASQPLERAIAFCHSLNKQLKDAKEIIDKAYQINNKINDDHLNEICKSEVHDREEEYRNANSLMRSFKRGPYLENMQRWLASERTVTMKRSLDKIIDGFMGITNGWLETLEKCRENYRKFTDDLTLLQVDNSAMRQMHQKILTRTYFMQENSPQENKLYSELFETPITTNNQNQQQLRDTRLSFFISSSVIDFFQNFSDVDTRPGIVRTARDIRAVFNQSDQQIEVYSPKDIMKNAKYWCHDIRNINFWDTMLADSMYQLSSTAGYPPLLATELKNNTESFITYDRTNFGSASKGQVKLYEDCVYADFRAGAAKFKLLDMTETVNIDADQRKEANRDLGQQFRMSAIRQTNGLNVASLSNYGTQYSVYRNKLKLTTSSAAATGTPVHVHLGEKYASKYEQMIIDEWQRLCLTSIPADDFTLPLPVVYAFQNKKLIKEFIWAGLYLNLITQEAAPGGGNDYCLNTPGGIKILLSKGQKMDVPLLTNILPEYISNAGRNSSLPIAQKEIAAALAQMVTDKNNDRVIFNNKMESIFVAPLNNLIAQSGHAKTTFIDILGAKRTQNVNTMSDLEKFELLCKCFILEELR